ncbi:MAG TPA: phytoene/squalene synthase family protein [Gemmatimonadales bacterium]|nr:phytoene/squalene synthase family protein [Gemmatimonadales bacterium]
MPLVSRTFALCIRFLPADLEWSVLVAYLLCRVADTIEDAAEPPPEEKRRLLGVFRDAVDDPARPIAALTDAFAHSASDDERLAAHADAVLRAFTRLPAEERAAIAPWVHEMCDGMAQFAEGTAAGPGRFRALPDLESLDRYCYYVAGTVGHLLTRLFRIRFPAGHPAGERLEGLATSFGLGLQLTNIIKDVAADRRRGWSFVPRDLCQLSGISPEELCDPQRRAEGRQVMTTLIDRARTHLDDAITYCTLLPHRAYGIRVFCLTSVYLAIRTLELAAQDAQLLDPGHTVKITRRQVYRSVAMTHLVAPSNRLIRRYYRHLAPTLLR